ncbi:MAG: alpha/beta fold hydrolase [Planctomycetes bacterium]|nr:alpha/beta fold hydrolase [Planctomycetota bacterium]
MQARINGIDMFYEESGAGIPILWVHGFPLDHSMWKPQLDGLVDCARNIAPDLRGFGRSEVPPGSSGMDLFADDLRALIDYLKLEQVVLAGLSMGGYIAMAFARRYPARLRGLMLIDTRAGADSPEAAQARRDNAARVRAEGVAPIAEPMLAKLLSATTRTQQPALAQALRDMLYSAPPMGVANALTGLADRPDSLLGLAAVAVPTLVVVGSDDEITPPADARRIAAAILHARLVEIPQAGHMANWEQPEAFNQAAREFLARLTHAEP